MYRVNRIHFSFFSFPFITIFLSFLSDGFGFSGKIEFWIFLDPYRKSKKSKNNTEKSILRLSSWYFVRIFYFVWRNFGMFWRCPEKSKNRFFERFFDFWGKPKSMRNRFVVHFPEFLEILNFMESCPSQCMYACTHVCIHTCV